MRWRGLRFTYRLPISDRRLKKERTSLPETQERSNQMLVIARLKQGTDAQARELIAQGPPFDASEMGFDRIAVYLTSSEVAFRFEGEGAAHKLAAVIDDMVVSASFSHWAALLEGTPKLAHEAYFWEADDQTPPSGGRK
jgi:hypothetical protein